LKKKKLELIIQ